MYVPAPQKTLNTAIDYIDEVFMVVSFRKISLFNVRDFNDSKANIVIRNSTLNQIPDKPTRVTFTLTTLLNLK